MNYAVEPQKHPDLFALIFTCVGEKSLIAGNKN